MKDNLKHIGIVKVINENRDFYKDILNSAIPGKSIKRSPDMFDSVNLEYDILVTNPPYSGEHKQRLLTFLTRTGKPFALLMPAYVATKSYWTSFVTTFNASSPKVRLPILCC